jgi:methyltransferase (TIGR00027 family)
MGLTLPVEAASDTAFLTAYWRALETARPDGHFRDPYARLLAGARGEQIQRRLPAAEASAAACIVRTCLVDYLLLEALRESTIDTVVNLGAGLDTRPYRLPLASSLCWIEVDNPAVLAYKAVQLGGCRPACALQSVSLDVTDVVARRRLLQRIGAAAQQVLVISEGLLVYFTAEQVASLAHDLHAQSPIRGWLCDLVSPTGFRLMEKSLAGSPTVGDVRLHFAPAEGPDFFRHYGWETTSYHSCVEEGQRLQRWFLPEALSARLSPQQWYELFRLFGVARLQREDRE